MRTTILLSLILTTAAAAVSDDSTIAELRTAFEDRTGQEQIAAASKLLAADPESAQKVVWFSMGFMSTDGQEHPDLQVPLSPGWSTLLISC